MIPYSPTVRCFVILLLPVPHNLLQAFFGPFVAPGAPVVVASPAIPLVAFPVAALIPVFAPPGGQTAISYGGHASIVNSGATSYVHAQQPAPQPPMTAGLQSIVTNVASGAIAGGTVGGGVVAVHDRVEGRSVWMVIVGCFKCKS